MLSAGDIAFLRSGAGQELLDAAARQEGEIASRVERLRKRWHRQQVSAALTLLDLRRRARAKFALADSMFFTPDGLEQSSGDAIASWRVGRFPSGASVLDLCCGIGGDSVCFAARGQTMAFDIDPAATQCAAANALAYGVHERLSAACADVAKLRLRGDAAFFDPSRRRGGRRVRAGEEYAPPLAFAQEVRQRVPDLAVKVSPALADPELQAAGGRVEFVSDRRECKEAILWFGALGPETRRSATILPEEFSLSCDPTAPTPPLSSPLDWLFELDPAVTRAHLIPEAARLLGASQLDRQVAYLTAAAPPPAESTMGALAASYRVIDSMPFSLARIQRRLRALGAHVYAVKRRGVPMDPTEIARQLKPGGDRPVVVVLTRAADEPMAILCDPP